MKKVLIGIAVLVVLIVGVGIFLPTTYSVDERIEIKATPEAIHAYVGDLVQWEAWAPWAKADPTVEITYGAITKGVGATQSWTSKDGSGELTLTSSDPKKGISYDMAFIIEGTRAPSTAALTYEVDGDITTVVWTMAGDTGDFIPPVIAGYVNMTMESAIGEMFQTGLTTLKETVE